MNFSVDIENSKPTGEDVKAFRRSLGLSLGAITRLCNVSHSAAYFWETGTRTPGRRSKEKLLEIIQDLVTHQDCEAVVEKRK
jgi:DNA-binding transcriptional regulator YiaG